jgi:hypothetical protein
MPIQTLWNTIRQTTQQQTTQTSRNATTLSQAQAQWTNLFQQRQDQHPAPTVLDGNRPLIISTANQRSNSPWGDELQEKQAKPSQTN